MEMPPITMIHLPDNLCSCLSKRHSDEHRKLFVDSLPSSPYCHGRSCAGFAGRQGLITFRINGCYLITIRCANRNIVILVCRVIGHMAICYPDI